MEEVKLDELIARYEKMHENNPKDIEILKN